MMNGATDAGSYFLLLVVTPYVSMMHEHLASKVYNQSVRQGETLFFLILSIPGGGLNDNILLIHYASTFFVCSLCLLIRK
jgi:hypothetical protein